MSNRDKKINEENLAEKPTPKSYRKLLVWLSSVLLFLMVIQTGFYFFAKPMLKGYVEKKVNAVTQGLYTVNFDDIKVNVAGQSLFITDFELVPDTILYRKLINKENYSKSLFNIKLDSLVIRKVRLLNLFGDKREFKIEEIGLWTPQITIVANPSEKKVPDISHDIKKTPALSIDSLKNQVLPDVFEYIYSASIERLKITNGNFGFLKFDKLKSSETFSADNISVIFNNFYIDKKNYKNRKDIFTEDIEIIIDGYTLNFEDEIHRIEAKQLYVSTKDKRIKLDSLRLYPGQINPESRVGIQENILNISLEQLVLENADFPEIYFDKKLHLTNAVIRNPKISIFKLKPDSLTTNKEKAQESIDLYEILKGKINITQIDTFDLQNAELRIFEKLFQRIPTTFVDFCNVKLTGFTVDENSKEDTNKILYADDIFVDIKHLQHRMKDSVHSLSANELYIDTKEQIISGKAIYLRPDNNLKGFAVDRNIEFSELRIPSVVFEGIDLHRFANFQELNIASLNVSAPGIKLERFSKKSKSKNQNSGLAPLTKDYLKKISIHSLKLNDGKFSVKTLNDGKEIKTSGDINFLLRNFKFNPHETGQTKFLYAENFLVNVDNYRFTSSESVQKIAMDKLKISTFDSEIYLKNFRLIPIDSVNIISKLRAFDKSVLIDFRIPELRVNEPHLHTALLDNNLRISNIDILNPDLEVITFPNISAKKSKLEFIEKIKFIAQNKLLSESSRVSDRLDTVTAKYSIVDYQLKNRKLAAIDSIQDFTFKLIKDLFVRAKVVDPKSGSYGPIDEIRTTAVSNIQLLAQDTLKARQIDSIRNFVFNKITRIKQEVEAPTVTKKELFAEIGNFLNIIDVDSFGIINASFSLKQQRSKKQKIIFDNKFSAKLIDFYFNYDSLESTSERLFFSENIEFNLKNYTFNLKDNVHILEVRNIFLSTLKSKITFDKVSLKPNKNSSEINDIPFLYYGLIDNITIQDFDMLKLYNDKFLDVSRLIVHKPLLAVVQGHKLKKDTLEPENKLTELVLPRGIKKMNVSVFEVDSGKFDVSRKVNNEDISVFNSDWNLKIYKFFIDSVSYLNQNLLYIPIENMDLQLTNIALPLSDSLHQIEIDSMNVSTEKKSLCIKNIRLSNAVTKEKHKVLYNAEKSELMDIFIPEICVTGMNYGKFNLQNSFNSASILIPKADVFIESFPVLKAKTGRKKKFNLDAVDLYSPLKEKINGITCRKLSLGNLSLKYHKHEKGKMSPLQLDNISAEVTNLQIDSAGHADKFLYSDDIDLSISNYSRPIKNGEQTLGAGKITLSTGDRSLYLNRFYLTPNTSYAVYAESNGTDKAITDIFAQRISLHGIDFAELAENKNIHSDSLVISAMDLFVYKNLNLKHDASLHKTLFVDKLLELPIGVNISSTKLRNSTVAYEQLSDNAHRVGKLYFSSVGANIINLTNDTAKINKGARTFVSAKAKLMGQGDVNLRILYFLNNPNNRFELTGSMTNTDLTLLNTYVSDAMNVKIKSGKLDDMSFQSTFSDSVAKGYVKMRYNELNAVLLRKDTAYNIIREEYKFGSYLANKLLIRSDNPRYGVYMKRGRIGYFHDWSYGEVKFWLMSIISGMQSTLLFDSQATRRIYRQSRREIRRKEKENRQRKKDDKLQK